MIAGGFGSCSTLVHVIAQHPKVAMMIGVVGTVVYLSGGAGPGYRNGNEKSISVLAQQVKTETEDSQIREAFNIVWNDEAPVSDSVVKEMIRKCGCDMTVETVKSDKQLLRNTAFLYFLDLAHSSGITGAQQTLKSELAVSAGGSTGRQNKR
jgi:hypothetical protein